MGGNTGMRLIALLALSCGVPAIAQSDAPLMTPVAEDGWIPFEDSADAIIVRIMVDGRPLNAVVDTGAPTTVIDRGWSSRNGLTVEPSEAAATRAGGGAKPIGVARFRSFTLGRFAQADGRLGVVDLSNLAAAAGRPIEGLVGADLLGHSAVQIDFDSHRLRLLPSGTTPPTGERAPLRRRGPALSFETEVRIDGRTLAPVMIDTGDDGSLAISRGALTPMPTGLRLTNIASAGLTGMTVEDYGRLATVTIGGATVRNVPATFGALPFYKGDMGRIGIGLLNRFNLFMDAGRGVLVLSPRRTPPPPPTLSLSGIQGMPTEASLDIAHVMRGSPAAAAGLRSGDRICGVDGRTLGGDAIRAALRGPAGKAVTLGLCDARNVRMTLVEFY